MIKFCLTGSIATGKTTVSNFLKELGCIIIDTDQVVHDLYNYPSKTSKKIINHFGQNLLENNQINRIELSKIVFSDKQKLKELNEIVHPDVKEEVYNRTKNIEILEKDKNKNYILVYVIPLFFETGSSYQVDHIIVSACSEKNQLDRLIERNSFSKEEAVKRIISQISISEKIKKADFIIDTNENLDKIKEQVKNLLDKFTWDKIDE
ncbi:MAG: dephospho-CoA kinase [Candidatus Sericytochromatia bacterium]